MTEITFTMHFRVEDESAFRRAAQQQTLDEGGTDTEAREFLDVELTTLADCAVMLLDPGSLPEAGMSILATGASQNALLAPQ
ncbi:MAG: hypothetical protein E2591_26695 [Achromobacter sp.]|uniref:hypothetical protein n=1 Tax=Achromobacter sp. TaxID=134375 RepID=UPI0012CAB076|nr:hypothetical protein [Achromobacter sp.]MPS81667.1 hypothetical protein [Achromobacter sp.]